MNGECYGRASPEQQQHIRLACQGCQRKKIKCDRNFPCGQCTRSSLHCEPSTRKPRTRHGGKRAIDSELRSRITRLESLVETLSSEVAGQDGEAANSGSDTPIVKDSASPAVGKYMVSPFWSSLTTEVQALRDALEDEQAEEDDVTSPPISSDSSTSADYDLIVCPPCSIYVMPGALVEPDPQLSETLCNIFCNNVDCMFKSYHTPTLKAFMLGGQPYLRHDPLSSCNKALKAAIWFSATNTLTERQCHAILGRTRSDALQRFKRMVDVALAQADLFNTTDLATLQAFCTYLAACRGTDASRRVWTLTSVAIRIARAMGLHQQSVSHPPFEAELRNRLWHQIRFLDVFTALDRGSEILLPQESFDAPLPKNVNDSDFNEASTTITEHASGLTDMTFALMASDATSWSTRLTAPGSKQAGDTWQQRLEYAKKFSDLVDDKYLKHCDEAEPFQRLLLQAGNCMKQTMRLRAVRPLQKHATIASPRVDDPFVLRVATDNLKANVIGTTDPCTGQWQWIMWVPWHALAVALAGLCSIRDSDLANEAWPLVEQTYALSARHVADARSGTLWRPIEKLYKFATTFRDHGVTSPSAIQQRTNPTSYDLFPPQHQQQQRQPAQSNILTPAQNSFDPNLNIPVLPSDNHNNYNNSNNTNLFPTPAPTDPTLPFSMPDNNNLLPLDTMDFSNLDLGLNSNGNNANADMSWTDFEHMLEGMSWSANMNFAEAAGGDGGGVGGGDGGGMVWSPLQGQGQGLGQEASIGQGQGEAQQHKGQWSGVSPSML